MVESHYVIYEINTQLLEGVSVKLISRKVIVWPGKLQEMGN